MCALAQCVAVFQIQSVMYLCARVGQLDYIHLSAPFVAVKNKEVNLTAVLWPSQVGTVTYIWWIGNNTEVNTPPHLSPVLLLRSLLPPSLPNLARLLTPPLQNCEDHYFSSYFGASRLEQSALPLISF